MRDQANVVGLGTHTGIQGPKDGAEVETKRHRSAAHSPAAAVLLTDKQAAELWGIGTTLFHELRARAPDWFPRAIQLSPKVVRYIRAEVEAAALAMPRQEKPSEPPALRRGRIERMKAAGASA